MSVQVDWSGSWNTTTAAVRRLTAQFSVEITPQQVGHVPTLRRLLPIGTRVYITHLPGPGLDGSADTAREVAAAGLRPVPHIAARSLSGVAELDRILRRMRAESGVDDLLLIAGGLTEPGPFTSTMQLLETGILLDHGIRSLGVAGHPEGSPDISADELAQAISQKNAYAERTGSELRIVTQFTFDPTPVTRWERELRDAGNRLPIHIGVPGAATIPTLLSYGLRCGIGPSLKVLRKQSRKVARLMTPTPHFPDATILGLAGAIADDPDCLLASIHLFPFGAIEQTVGWAAELQRGEFEVGLDHTLRTLSRP